MLRRTLLAAALCGVLSTAAAQPAMHLSATGTGQVLIYPYYTTHGGLTTVFTVANTTSTVRALKVRLLEGVNSKPVLDFNLYMSPFATFAAAVALGGDDTQPARLVTQDRSCTVPAIPAGGLALSTTGFTSANQDWDSAGTSPARAAVLGSPLRTRDGHIEVIEMGELRPASPLSIAATFNFMGVPSNCALLINQWAPGGAWATNPGTDIQRPRGGIGGTAALVEAAAGLIYGYAPTAIENFYLDAAAPGALHAAPSSSLPDLRSARTTSTSVRVLLHPDAVRETRVETFPAALPRPDPVSLLLTTARIDSDYSLDPGLGSETEWVFTMPTRRWYVEGSAPQRPFTDAFTPDGRACELTGPWFHSRTGALLPRQGDTPPGIIPPPLFPPDPRLTRGFLCASTSAVAARNVGPGQPLRLLRAREDQTGFLLGSFRGWTGFPVAGTLAPVTFDDFDRVVGSGMLRLPLITASGVNPTLVGPSGRRYVGLPLIGLAFTRYINANAQPGVLANYSVVTPVITLREESEPPPP
jgi:hypothetical protein